MQLEVGASTVADLQEHASFLFGFESARFDLNVVVANVNIHCGVLA